MEHKRSDIWLYFKALEDEQAECRYCGNVLSIRGGSSGNLLRHLRKRHMIEENSSETLTTGTLSIRIQKEAKKRSAIWDHYNRIADKTVQCRYCEAILSIKGSITSLARHMRKKHPTIELATKTVPKNNPPAVKNTFKTERKRSTVWNHFDPMGDRTSQCRYCQSKIRGSSGNLFRHLKHKHATVKIAAETIPRDTSLIIGLPEDAVSPPSPARSCSPAAGSVLGCADESEESASESDDQPEIDLDLFYASGFSFVQPSSSNQRSSGFSESVAPIMFEKSKKIDDQLLKMIVKEYRPFSIVEGIEFQEFVHLLCPGYSLPSRKTLTNNTMPNLYRKMVNRVNCALKNCNAIALRTGTLSAINKASFLTVTAHFLDKETKLKSFLLGCIEFRVSHTAANIARKLMKMCEEWDIQNKVVAVVTDNTENVVAAVHEINFTHLPCFAQTVDLIVDRSIEKISSTLNKCKNVAQYFKPGSAALSKLNEVQAQMEVPILKLKQSVGTGWSSSFEMLERFLENMEPLISVLVILQVEEKLQVSAEEWRTIEQAVAILRVFSEITEEISAEEHVSSSKTILLKHMMQSRVEFFLNSYYLELGIIEMANELLSQISKSLEAWDSSELITESILLDPRFKNFGFADDESSFWGAYNSLVEKLEAISTEPTIDNGASSSLPAKKVQNLPETSLWKQFDEEVNELTVDENLRAAGVVELDRFLEEPLLERTGDPLEWWNHYRLVYPNLYSFVLKRLCIPAMSFPCERIFSKDANTLTEKRNRLLSKNLSMILFINHNLSFDNQK